MISCALVGLIFNILANRSASYVAKVVTRDLRHDLFVKIESLTSSQIDEVTMPSLISRMTTDTYNVHQMVGMMQRIGVRAPILLIGGIVATLIMDVKLTLILLCILPLVVIITFVITKLGLPLFTKVQESLDHLVRIIRENINGIRVIKALSKTSFEKERYGKINKEVMDYELKSGNLMAIINPTMNMLLNMGLVLVVVIGAQRVKDGDLEIGKIISFTSYFTIILNAMLTITRIFTIYSRSNASAIRIDYIFNLPVLLEKKEHDEASSYEIEFRNVSFSYHGHKDQYDITNLNVALKKGESLGIIGATGSGKTTIISLLMRMYEVSEGSIFIKGKNIQDYELSELRKLFGVALQNDTIFSSTVRENIDFYRGISEDEIIKASKTACAHEFIEKFENQYDELLSAKGTNISGGQKQRIYIARALANNPNILILDDSSSALDYKTDALVKKGISENYKIDNTIIIAQRISAILKCDQIIMIDNGVVIGAGTHEYLLKTLPEYKEIYDLQMGDRQPFVKKGGSDYE